MDRTTLFAAFWMIGAITSFTLMAIAGRAVSFELDTFEIMLFRSLLGIVVVVSCAAAFGTLHEITNRHLGLHLIRNISHFTGQNLWFLAIAMIPLAQVFALEFTTPIWAILLSALLLGERLTTRKLCVALIGFAGILIVTRPGLGSLNWGVAAAAVAAIGFAGSAVFTRKLTRTESVTCVLFYLTTMQAVFGLICAGYDFDITTPSWASLPWVVLIGFAGLVAHFCLTKALSMAPASVVMPVDFVRLPVIAILGALIYAEDIDLWVFLGAVVIFSANYYNILKESQTATKK
jgi:drug/metabolite transporter (DMT)-like permease